MRTKNFMRYGCYDPPEYYINNMGKKIEVKGPTSFFRAMRKYPELHYHMWVLWCNDNASVWVDFIQYIAPDNHHQFGILWKHIDENEHMHLIWML